ncbi:unnamed protein product, partial [Ixodes persulcatus]
MIALDDRQRDRERQSDQCRSCYCWCHQRIRHTIHLPALRCGQDSVPGKDLFTFQTGCSLSLQLEPIKSSHPTAKYTSILHGTLCILREEGFTAFWKGHVPAQMLSVVYGGVQFSSYEYLLKRSDSTLGREAVIRWSNTVHFACGFTSGCVSTAVAHPFDVIRTRLVAQLEPKTYTSISQAVRLMWRQEGPRSFYRGMLPTLLQIGPLSGFQFGFYHFFTHLWTLLLEDDANVTGMRSVACGALSGIVSKTLVYPLDLIKKRLQASTSFSRPR